MSYRLLSSGIINTEWSALLKLQNFPNSTHIPNFFLLNRVWCCSNNYNNLEMEDLDPTRLFVINDQRSLDRKISAIRNDGPSKLQVLPKRFSNIMFVPYFTYSLDCNYSSFFFFFSCFDFAIVALLACHFLF